MTIRGFSMRLAALALAMGAARASAADAVRNVAAVPSEGANGNYVGNRPPLLPSPLIKLPIGAIKPKGWLAEMLRREADGMAGHLTEISTWCKFEGNAWTDPKGAGKNGWEEVPYWLKGFGDLGYVTGDQRIQKETKRWLDAIFAAQRENGYFGPETGLTALKGKPDLWPHMPVLNAMQSYYEFSGDRRVIDLMTRYFKWQNALPESDLFTGYWDKMRTGDNLESVYWLYNRTGDASLLELAAKLHKHAAGWGKVRNGNDPKNMPNWHNVNVAEGFREPATWYLQSKDKKDYDATVNVYNTVMNLYGQFPGGGFAGDENCRPGYTDPRQGFETCGMVEYLHSFELLTRFVANPIWSDRAEDVMFNSFPAALTPDFKALHYLTGANMVQLDKANKAPGIQNGGTMLSYSPGGVYRCCQHNHGMGPPYYAEELWLATADDGLCASLYAASEVTAKVSDGKSVTIIEQTDYPFSDIITLKVDPKEPTHFPLYLRVPGWCNAAKVEVNGAAVDVNAEPSSYLVVDRDWKSGDVVTLHLPMKVGVRKWEKNKDAVSIEYGPLTFSLDIGAKWSTYGDNAQWPEFEVFPTTDFNYGLELNPQNPAAGIQVTRKPGPIAAYPFTLDDAPIRATVKGRKIAGWTVDKNNLLTTLQPSPIKSDAPIETLALIPMGAARLRVSAFPTIGHGPDAHEWKAPVKSDIKATASHCNEGDDVDAMLDGQLPSASNDQSIPRMTFWDRRGGVEWVQYDFKSPRKVSAVEVYWFDDTGVGQCRVPKSWRVLYQDGGQWKPVQGTSDAAVKTNAFNKVSFTPVTTQSLRLEVHLQPNFSAGILEWKVD